MINAALELGRTVGLKPAKDANGAVLPIVSGQYVRFDSTSEEAVAGLYPEVIVAKGDETIAEVGDVLGIAADDTQYKGFNGFYETIDGFYKYHKVSAFLLGGKFEIWNDGRGAVYAGDPESGESGATEGSVIGALPGTPLYINADGVLGTEAGAEGTLGGEAVGIVLRAPVSADQKTAAATAGVQAFASEVLAFKAFK